MADNFPSAEQIADQWEQLARGFSETGCTVEQVNADNGAVTATAEDVPHFKEVHSFGTISVGDGTIPDERCRFWLIARAIAFTVKGRDRIIDTDGLVWKADSVRYEGRGAITLAECSRARS